MLNIRGILVRIILFTEKISYPNKMNYLFLLFKMLMFGATLFFLLEFMVGCDLETWKCALLFGGMAALVIFVFFATKQHKFLVCKSCKNKISPLQDQVSTTLRSIR
jgi:hypothetical protein